MHCSHSKMIVFGWRNEWMAFIWNRLNVATESMFLYVGKCKSAEFLVCSKHIGSFHFAWQNSSATGPISIVYIKISRFECDERNENYAKFCSNVTKNYLRSKLFINFSATFSDYARIFEFESQYWASCFIRSNLGRVLSFPRCFSHLPLLLFLFYSCAIIG